MAELRVIKGGCKIKKRHDNSWLADRYIDNAAKTLTDITRGGRGTQDPRWTKYVYLIVKAVVCRCHATKRNDFESLEYAVELLGPSHRSRLKPRSRRQKSMTVIGLSARITSQLSVRCGNIPQTSL